MRGHDGRERLEIERGRLRSLVDAVRDLASAGSLADVQRIVRSAARELAQADGATFVLRDGTQCFYADEDAIAPLWKGQRFPMETCISGWAMANGATAVIGDIYDDDRIPHDAYRPTFVQSLMMVPIRPEAPVGAIGTYWATRHEATATQRSLVEELAHETSLVLTRAALAADLGRVVAI